MNPFRKKAPPAIPAWHPDFRDPTSLPDMKVVRTSFFINGLGVLLFLAAAVLLGFQEVKRFSLQAETRLLEAKIQEHKDRNDRVVKLDSEFKSQERLIKEVSNYLDQSLELSTLFIALANTLHSGMTFSTIRFQDETDRGKTTARSLLLNGSITATPDIAATTITEYLDVFQEDPFLSSLVGEAVPTALVPAPEGNKMAFGIRLRLSGKPRTNQKEKK